EAVCVPPSEPRPDPDYVQKTHRTTPHDAEYRASVAGAGVGRRTDAQNFSRCCRKAAAPPARYAPVWRADQTTKALTCRCGGSEVRIILAASPRCGLLNQSHTRSISC